jgi:glycosyltransferase involved in cell wall biosynthesis
MPKVSVIITTHNRCDRVPRTIESVRGQTFADRELIVVDDASVDGTPAVLAAHEAAGDLRAIRVAESRGANHARNVGLGAATGEYLAYLDDDDSWFPEKLARQVAVMESQRDVVLVGCWFLRRGQVQKPPALVSEAALLSENLIGGFSMCMFRRADALALGGLDEALRNCQDWDLWLRLAERGRVVCVPECLVDYYLGAGDQITNQANRTVHYENYLKVVERHAHKMGVWTRAKHRRVVAYHTTPRSRWLSRGYAGLSYWIVRTVDRLALRWSPRCA